MDLNGDGLADVEETTSETTEQEVDENGNVKLPAGSYYDKGGNLITP